MAANNIRVIKRGLTVQRFRAESNAYVGLKAGDAVKIGGTGTNYAIPCLNGDPAQATDMFIGVTKSDATNTASADGIVDVELVCYGTILEAKANTVANVSTDAELLGILFDFVAFDRSADTAAGVLTVDENEGTSTTTRGLVILDGRITDGLLYFTPGLATPITGTTAAA